MMGIGFLELVIVLGVLAAVAVGLVIAVTSAVSRRSGYPPTGNPNLFPCPDCGRLISIRAATCPHCGGPTVRK